MKHIDLPSTLKKIEYNAFKKCMLLTSIRLPAGLETIGMYAFSKSELETIEMPKSVKTICQGAFSDCANLRRVALNDGLEVLGTD